MLVLDTFLLVGTRLHPVDHGGNHRITSGRAYRIRPIVARRAPTIASAHGRNARHVICGAGPARTPIACWLAKPSANELRGMLRRDDEPGNGGD